MNPRWLGEPFAFKDNKLCLARKVHKRLLAEAQEAFPYEYSALLTGRGTIITGHIPMSSAGKSLHTFTWDGAAFLKALTTIRESDLQWLGVLHSHPSSPPIPSRRDSDEWHYPSLSYWIVSLASSQPQWRVYQWQNGAFEARSYTVIDAT